MGTSTKPITYEDSLTMPENRFEEIVYGESRVMPPAIKNHVFLIEKLSEVLRSQVDPREYFVTVAGAGLGIERVPLTYRVPDLMLLRTAALRQDRAQTAKNDPFIWTVPDLIVECLSPSNRKGSILELLRDYARIAVPEVWLLDSQPPRFTSYGYESGSMRQCQTIESGRANPLLLPNVTVDLAELWDAFAA